MPVTNTETQHYRPPVQLKICRYWSDTPTQYDIDCAYAVKIFADHRPARDLSVTELSEQAGIPRDRLQAAFLYQFNITLDSYLKQILQKIGSET